MYEFLATATDQHGKRSTRIVKAETSREAVAQLEAEGCTEIVLHIEDAGAVSAKVKYEDLEGITPEDLLELRAMSSFGLFWFLVKRLYYTLRGMTLLSVAYIAYCLYQSRPIGFWFYFAAAMLLLPMGMAFYFAFFGSSRKFEQFLDHWCWGRWDEVLKLAPQFKKDVPVSELNSRVAVALAKSGDYEKGLALMTSVESDPNTPRWMYLGRLAEFYGCLEKRNESLNAMRQAYEEAPDNPTVIFDYALILLKMEINLDEADRLLEAVEAQPLSDLLQMLLPFGHGLQQLNHKRYVEARDLLIESRRCLMPMAALPLVQMFLDFNAAYLAIASARCGDLPTALKFYRPAKKRLEAMGYTMLLARLNEALQGYV